MNLVRDNIDTTPASERLLTAAEVASRLRITPRCLRNWMLGPAPIPFFRIGRTVRFRWSAIELWLADHRNVTTDFNAVAEATLAELSTRGGRRRQ